MMRLLLLPSGQTPLVLGRAVRRTFAWFAIIVLTLIVVGHGCHGDEVDHEPGVLPLRPLNESADE